MTLRDFSFLADENISPDVIALLRHEGLDVLSVEEAGMNGYTDRQLIRIAFAENRIILTHDSDFGTLAIRDGEPWVGIFFLRPGHVPPVHAITALNRILRDNIDFNPPFLVVCKTFPIFRLRIR